MTWEQVIAEEDSEDDVDEDVADIEDRIVCSIFLFPKLLKSTPTKFQMTSLI